MWRRWRRRRWLIGDHASQVRPKVVECTGCRAGTDPYRVVLSVVDQLGNSVLGQGQLWLSLWELQSVESTVWPSLSVVRTVCGSRTVCLSQLSSSANTESSSSLLPWLCSSCTYLRSRPAQYSLHFSHCMAINNWSLDSWIFVG